MSLEINRREALALGVASVAAMSFGAQAGNDAPSPVIKAHDERLKRMLEVQVADPASRWCGGIPDSCGIHYCHTAAAFLRDAAAAYFHPQSAFHADKEVFARIGLAAGFLARCQNGEGHVDLFSTNFNSTPDTGFVVHSVATAATLAKMHHNKPVLALLDAFLRRAGHGLAVGGIHTPNHRWVVCAALAQIHRLFPEKHYLQRIDQWLAEGIDIDAEGQYTERSTAGYNAIVDTAFVVAAHKLKRPELLEPVRKNLDAMAYLLHPGGEVVTEISSRQDLNTRGTLSGYWFPLRYMAIRERNGLYASMLASLEPEHVELARLMEYPDLAKSLPAPSPIPDDYEREYPLAGITRIRRGKTSVTILHQGSSRWISLRRGDAVVNAIRFATAFFGRGQFIPTHYEKRDDGFHFRQELQGRYLQPITDPALLPVCPETWGLLVEKRERSEICRLVYEAHVRETQNGIEISIGAEGTKDVPLAVEINLREGGTLSGATPVPNTSDVFLLNEGFAEFAVGADILRLGPGRADHAWVQLRGAEAKLPGPSLYITAYTPFKHTITFTAA